MIARIIFLLIPMIVLSDFYIERYFLRNHPRYTPVKRLFWWLPGTLMLLFCLALACCGKFVPDDIRWIKAFLILLGIVVVPKTVFAIISLFGRLCRCSRRNGRLWNLFGLVLGIICGLTMVYGVLIGPRKLRVTRLELAFKDLPEVFDGLRIVLFSDAHVGTFNNGWEHLLQRDIDTILAQRPDMICFVGDLQNTQPAELLPNMALLSRLSKQGVPMYSVLGNHDYSQYFYGDSVAKKACEEGIKTLERRMGWRLLLNEHAVFYSKDKRDSIVIAGEENCGVGHFPDYSDLSKTLKGVNRKAFVVLLQHDPKSWESRILPKSHAQLTLCGHTHGGQINLFGLRPTMISYHDDYGLDEKDGRFLYVTCGIGGLAPIRIGVDPEIAVITLRTKK